VIRNFGKMSERKDLLALVSEIIKEESPAIFDLKIDELERKMQT
jgi:hypothetical protein